jgi:DNA uptake protein ComE-like DNA-binding protein
MKKGVILIITLWILVTLSLLSLALSHHQRLSINLVSLYSDETKTLWLIKEDLYKIIVELGRDQTPYETLEEIESLGIGDEDSKININTVSEEMLKRIPGISLELAEDIVGNRPFYLIEELLLLEKVTAEIYYGNPLDNSQPGLKKLITTFGDGKININTAPIEVLLAIPKVSKSTAEAIIEYRENNPFSEDGQILEVLQDIGIPPEEASEIANLTKTSSSIFTLNLKKKYNKAKKTIEVKLKRDKEYIEIIFWKES